MHDPAVLAMGILRMPQDSLAIAELRGALLNHTLSLRTRQENPSVLSESDQAARDSDRLRIRYEQALMTCLLMAEAIDLAIMQAALLVGEKGAEKEYLAACQNVYRTATGKEPPTAPERNANPATPKGPENRSGFD